MMKVTDTLAAVGDPATMVRLADSMRATSPYVVGLQCLRVRGYSDLGKFDVTAGILHAGQNYPSQRHLLACRCQNLSINTKQAIFPRH